VLSYGVEAYHFEGELMESQNFQGHVKLAKKQKHNLRKKLCKEVLNKWSIHQEMMWSYACQQFTLRLSPKLFHLNMTT
jgi:hypothetical protein